MSRADLARCNCWRHAFADKRKDSRYYELVERVLPGKAEMGKAVDSYLLDLEMLVNTPGGRERSESEFREILNAAGFGPLRLIPTSTATSILKARPA
jgi:hypothetical protein